MYSIFCIVVLSITTITSAIVPPAPPPPPPAPPPPPTFSSNLFPVGYTKLEKKTCKPTIESYNDPLEAQAACDSNKKCFAIVDEFCNGRGEVSLCQEWAVKNESKGIISSCIYKKDICQTDSQCTSNKDCILDICLEPCESKLCNDHGKCYLDVRGNETCACDEDYSGPNCQYLIHFVEAKNTWCRPSKDVEYHNFQKSKDACHRDEACKMFYDIQSKNKTFVLCE